MQERTKEDAKAFPRPLSLLGDFKFSSLVANLRSSLYEMFDHSLSLCAPVPLPPSRPAATPTLARARVRSRVGGGRVPGDSIKVSYLQI